MTRNVSLKERFKFWSDIQRKPGETLQMAARIRQDAATCDFPSITDPQDEALKQRFISSVNKETVLKAFFKSKGAELDFVRSLLRPKTLRRLTKKPTRPVKKNK